MDLPKSRRRWTYTDVRISQGKTRNTDSGPFHLRGNIDSRAGLRAFQLVLCHQQGLAALAAVGVGMFVADELLAVDGARCDRTSHVSFVLVVRAAAFRARGFGDDRIRHGACFGFRSRWPALLGGFGRLGFGGSFGCGFGIGHGERFRFRVAGIAIASDGDSDSFAAFPGFRVGSQNGAGGQLQAEHTAQHVVADAHVPQMVVFAGLARPLLDRAARFFIAHHFADFCAVMIGQQLVISTSELRQTAGNLRRHDQSIAVVSFPGVGVVGDVAHGSDGRLSAAPVFADHVAFFFGHFVQRSFGAKRATVHGPQSARQAGFADAFFDGFRFVVGVDAGDVQSQDAAILALKLAIKQHAKQIRHRRHDADFVRREFLVDVINAVAC